MNLSSTTKEQKFAPSNPSTNESLLGKRNKVDFCDRFGGDINFADEKDDVMAVFNTASTVQI